MKEVLLVARLGKFFSDFEISNIKILQEMGCDVWCAANFEGDNHKLDSLGVHKVHIDLLRSPVSWTNFKGYRQLIALMKEHDFRLVHCHMPVGGVIARLAAHKTKTKPVLYTAHGFQFMPEGRKIDWLFYPIEKYMSRYTDVLITINEEDYKLAKKFHMKKLVRLHGIGVDFEKYAEAKSIRKELSQEFDFEPNDFIILSVGELRKLKNHEIIIQAIAQLQDSTIQYFICGTGELQTYLEELIKKQKLEKQVHLLGYREDIANICKSVDLFAFPSTREGLSVALLEALASGLPAVVSSVRGNVELVENGKNGILCHRNMPEEYSEAINTIRQMDRRRVMEVNRRILQLYRKEHIMKEMREIYKNCLCEV